MPRAKKKTDTIEAPESELSSIKGIGPAREELLALAGVRTIEDLLYRFPRRYLDRTLATSTAFRAGVETTLIVTVENSYLAHGKRSRLVVHCKTLNGESLSLVFFRGVGYFRRVFQKSVMLVVSGKLESFGGMQIAHPDFEVLDSEDSETIHTGRIVPVYPGTEDLKKRGLDSRGFRRILHSVLDNGSTLPDLIPNDLLDKHGYLKRMDALREIHFPESMDSLRVARNSLKFEELFLFSCHMKNKRSARLQQKRELWPLPYGKSEQWIQLKQRLPFTPTGEQNRAIEVILADAQANHATAFLLQGDVGSGKTLVAIASMLHYVANNVQCALLVPTEVLARQHFRTFMDLLALSGVQIELLLGAEPKKSKAGRIDRIQRGEADIVIGTHSLLEPEVTFAALGLVVVDEQHRFGVEQRETLRKKGRNPDVVGMTATPIPRTLCLTEFADLKLVTLLEKPAGRLPIKTMRLGEDKRSGMYKSIRNHVTQGRQCYIVYPVIDESEKSDLRAATDGFQELQTAIFPDLKLELLHGRMKTDEKDRVMSEFRAGKIQILVSTTVIEVGVDVPNATIMVIEHADRFGISQLHQLRGRVGRGSEESFCVLMAGPGTEEAEERLSAVVATENGFDLAETDLKIRGPGEILGKRQHGVDGLRIANLMEDRKLVEVAFESAEQATGLPEAALEFIKKRFATTEQSLS
ncbi:MAG: ATP-dependent DNA helicase RecG [Spirochaetia bacterium]|nr:ATP-dependent DNA helicase RecG [Spirochaetia bacterium]